MTVGRSFYLTLLETAPLKTVDLQTEYLDYFSRNIQSFGLSLICVVSDKKDTRKIDFKIASQRKTTYPWVVDFLFQLVTVCTCDC